MEECVWPDTDTHVTKEQSEKAMRDSDTPKVIPDGTVSLVGWIRGPAKFVSPEDKDYPTPPYKCQVVHLR